MAHKHIRLSYATSNGLVTCCCNGRTVFSVAINILPHESKKGSQFDWAPVEYSGDYCIRSQKAVQGVIVVHFFIIIFFLFFVLKE